MAKSKYNNKKTPRMVNGEAVMFDSIAEAKRFDELFLLARAGKIRDLTLQPKFLILGRVKIDGHKTMPERNYIADFRYYNLEGHQVVEDVKGMKTPVYNLKKQMFLKIYGHELIFKEIM